MLEQVFVSERPETKSIHINLLDGDSSNISSAKKKCNLLDLIKLNFSYKKSYKHENKYSV